jgi:nitroimidazol reductase NimA-like FMN-containing flavoprotein (pyridoxamine 5'-phosphate oxidase superfamily)
MIGTLSADEIELLLKEHVAGHLGCNDGFNTYVYPINYVYDGHFILCHSAPGAKLDIMRQNNRVCFQVDDRKDFMHWRSVMVQGIFQELEEERARYAVMKIFTEKNLHQKIGHAMLQHTATGIGMHKNLHGNNRPVFYRIVINVKTGRFENE